MSDVHQSPPIFQGAELQGAGGAGGGSYAALAVSKVVAPAETCAPTVAFVTGESEDTGFNEVLFRPTAQEP
ncbi:MAG TPA: hypothetical protein PL183_10715 [Aquamicrobium sp.]|nr:hypothetical protein [Aquamicrobium sp.]